MRLLKTELSHTLRTYNYKPMMYEDKGIIELYTRKECYHIHVTD